MDDLFPLGGPGDIETLLRHYASGELTPTQVVERVHPLVSNDDSNAWIYVAAAGGIASVRAGGGGEVCRRGGVAAVRHSLCYQG